MPLEQAAGATGTAARSNGSACPAGAVLPLPRLPQRLQSGSAGLAVASVISIWSSVSDRGSVKKRPPRWRTLQKLHCGKTCDVRNNRMPVRPLALPGRAEWSKVHFMMQLRSMGALTCSLWTTSMGFLCVLAWLHSVPGGRCTRTWRPFQLSMPISPESSRASPGSIRSQNGFVAPAASGSESDKRLRQGEFIIEQLAPSTSAEFARSHAARLARHCIYCRRQGRGL